MAFQSDPYVYEGTSVLKNRLATDTALRLADLTEKRGLNTSVSVNIFFLAFLQNGGLPFDVTLPETPKERAEINRILDERQALVGSGQVEWIDHDQVQKIVGL